MAIAPISYQLSVEASPEEVFRMFTARLGDWWPIAYTFSEADFEDAVVEPRVGGRWLERDRRGVERPWGEVRVYEPPRLVVVTFAIGADREPTPPERASEVGVRFEPDGRGTRVLLEHRDFERHGPSGHALRSGLASPQGWPLILAELRRAVRRQRGRASVAAARPRQVHPSP